MCGSARNILFCESENAYAYAETALDEMNKHIGARAGAGKEENDETHALQIQR